MTFEMILGEACAVALLPETARSKLPSALSDIIKKMVLKLSPEEFGKMISTAIDKINNGSVESVDALVRSAIDG